MTKTYTIEVSDGVAKKIEDMAKEEGLTVEHLFIKALKGMQQNKQLKQKLITMIEEM